MTAKQPHGIILPAPCLTVSYCCSMWSDNFVSYNLVRVFLQRVFSLAMWSAANFSQAWRCPVWSKGSFLSRQPLSSCWCETHSTVDTDTCLPAASNSLQTCFLVVFGWLLTVLTSFLSAASDSLWFPIVPLTKLCHALNTYKKLCVQMIFGPVTGPKIICTHNFSVAPNDFLDLFKSMLGSSKSILRSSDFHIVVFVSVVCVCIKQAYLLKWAQKSDQLLSIRIIQRKLRGHATKNICFTQLPVITKIDHSSCCIYIYDPADWVSFSEDL